MAVGIDITSSMIKKRYSLPHSNMSIASLTGEQPDHCTTKQEDIDHALHLLPSRLPFSRRSWTSKRQELLNIWDPRRYANLTNNPKTIHANV